MYCLPSTLRRRILCVLATISLICLSSFVSHAATVEGLGVNGFLSSTPSDGISRRSLLIVDVSLGVGPTVGSAHRIPRGFIGIDAVCRSRFGAPLVESCVLFSPGDPPICLWRSALRR